MTYADFLSSKHRDFDDSGFDVVLDDVNVNAFDWQRLLVRWATRKGRSALFLDTGLGKTLHELEWCRLVYEHTREPVLLVAPLAVSFQTAREAGKFAIDCPVRVIESAENVGTGINIVNYEKLPKLEGVEFGGVCLDESSILKCFASKYRAMLTERFEGTRYKLACTATPSPNDYMELGNHAEFLGVCSRAEMLCTYFVHDSSNTSKWRLKGHAEDDFWRWVSGWATMIRKPSDLGFPNDGYDLPPLTTEVIEVPWFGGDATTLTEQRVTRELSVQVRAARLAELVATKPGEPWLIWCDRNDEATAAIARVPDAVEVAGSMKPDVKTERLLGFTDGDIRVLVTKPKIAGFGMNWQHCANVVFLGLSHSFEAFYQSVRRCYRFGQTRPVTAYVIVTDKESAITENILRKQEMFDQMASAMAAKMQERIREDIFDEPNVYVPYQPTHAMETPAWL